MMKKTFEIEWDDGHNYLIWSGYVRGALEKLMGIEASLKADVRVREISCGNYVVKEPEKFTNPPLVVVGNYEGKMDVSAGCIGGGLKIIKDLTLQICELKNENEKLKQQIPEIKPNTIR